MAATAVLHVVFAFCLLTVVIVWRYPVMTWPAAPGRAPLGTLDPMEKLHEHIAAEGLGLCDPYPVGSPRYVVL